MGHKWGTGEGTNGSTGGYCTSFGSFEFHHVGLVLKVPFFGWFFAGGG